MHTAVVIPTYNEHESIKRLLNSIFSLGIAALEVIVVDDSSSDRTLDILRALKKKFRITLIVRPRKMGLGSALKDGLALARNHRAGRVITMDGDESHDPQCIKTMLERLEEGAERLERFLAADC